MARAHKDVEFALEDLRGAERIYKSFDKACGDAITMAASSGRTVHLDVLIYSKSGARAWAGPNGVEQYDEDPEASVFERLAVSVDMLGRVA